MSLNKVILIGRLTNDVEVQEINEKSSKAKFTKQKTAISQKLIL